MKENTILTDRQTDRRYYSSTTKEIQNYYGIDVLKLLLAIIVVLRHAGQNYWEVDSLFFKLMVNTISPLAVPLFFAASSFLFFAKKDLNGNRIKKQLKRILKLYLIWTLIYFPLIIYDAINYKSMSVSEWCIGFIKNLFFSGSYYHLWYLPALMVALFLVAALLKKLPNLFLLSFGGLLYLIGIMVDTYHFYPVFTFWDVYHKLFITTRNGLFFGFVFVAIGKTIAENLGFILRISKRTIGIAFAFGLLIMSLESCFINQSIEIINMNFSSLLLTPVVLIISIRFPCGKIVEKRGKDFRNMSTILFCSHPLVFFVVQNLFRKFSIYTSPMTITLLVLLVSLVFSFCYVIASKKYVFLKHLL